MIDRQETPGKAACPNCSTLWLTRGNTIEMVRVCSGCRRSALPAQREHSRPGYVWEVLEFLKARTVYWMAPVAIVMLAFAGLILLAQFQQ